MRTHLLSFIIVLITFLLMDGIWLTSMKSFYASHLGHLMSPTLALGAIAVFYPLYAFGLSELIIIPNLQASSSLSSVFIMGSLLGLMCYGTYDLTNHATLKDWPLIVTSVDMVWGTLLSGTACAITYWIARTWIR